MIATRADADPTIKLRCAHCQAAIITRSDNGQHTAYHDVRRTCMFGSCAQFFCPACRRYQWGTGRYGCPCDWGRTGHNTWAEFPRPRLPYKPGHGRVRRLSRKRARLLTELKEIRDERNWPIGH